MHIEELDNLIDRKQFLLRRENTNNSDDPVAEAKEIEVINEKIAKVTQRVLAEEAETLTKQMKEGTAKVFTDGNFKRTVARILITFLKRMYEDDDIRGIMRQGYKIMRNK